MNQKWKCTLILLLLFSYCALAQEVEIKSLKAYLSNNQTSVPIITSYSSGNNFITIEFDVKSEFEPNLDIVFRFCDRNWHPTNNVFLNNLGHNIIRNINLNLLPIHVEGARYHFKESFPDKRGEVDFPFSGKWMFFVTESSDTSVIYASGKFIVIKDSMEISTSIKNENLENEYFTSQDLSKVFNISVNFMLPQEFYPSNLQNIEIIENHKLNYPYIINRDKNNNNHAFYWDGSNKFRFFTKEIKPGNEYRQTDLRDPNIYNGIVNAQRDGIDSPRRYFEERKDHNGGSILLNYKNEYADYLHVNFNLKPVDIPKNRVFVVGAFSNWEVLPDYELVQKDGFYKGAFELKRGVYDYQYVTADEDNGHITNIDWLSIEGNSWYTSNEYYILVYYFDTQKGGYDRIIGYKKIVSE